MLPSHHSSGTSVPRQVGGADYTLELYGVRRVATQRRDEQHVFGSCLPRFSVTTQRHKGSPQASPSIPSKPMFRLSNDTPCVGAYELTSENPLLNRTSSVSAKGFGQLASREDRFSNNQTFIGNALSKAYGTPGPGSYNVPRRAPTTRKVNNLCFGSTQTHEPIPFAHTTPAPGQYEQVPQPQQRPTRVSLHRSSPDTRKRTTHMPSLPSINN